MNANEGKENYIYMKNVHFQRKKWRHDSRNAICWSFYCVNDNKPIDVK
jgi:hypothetical protein